MSSPPRHTFPHLRPQAHSCQQALLSALRQQNVTQALHRNDYLNPSKSIPSSSGGIEQCDGIHVQE